MDKYENLMVNPIAPWKLDKLQKETACDPILLMLMNTINSGWPKSLKETDSELQLYLTSESN